MALFILQQAQLMTEKIGFPDYILDPVELDKDYEGVGDHFTLCITKCLPL